MMRHVYIVDDDDAVRMSLHSMLALRSDQAVQSFRSGDDFLEHASELEPGVVLLDFYMPGSSGMDVLDAVQERQLTKFATIILTGEGNVDLAVRAMKAGALDLLEKPFEASLLLDVVDTAFARLAHQDADAAHRERACALVARLSGREREVLTGLIEGRANKAIAFALDISPRTVEIYRANLMTKLDVRSLPAMLRVAYAAGLIPAT